MERSWRLRKGLEFDTAYAKGTVTNGPLLIVRALPNGVGHPRWGYAVGKRIAKSAVVRNRARRRLREAAAGVGDVGGWDFVVTARARALSADWDELSGAVRRQVRRATAAKVDGRPNAPASSRDDEEAGP